MIIKLNDILWKFSCTALIIREKLTPLPEKRPIASWRDHKKVDERRTHQDGLSYRPPGLSP